VHRKPCSCSHAQPTNAHANCHCHGYCTAALII
jgi:hypothetical protein